MEEIKWFTDRPINVGPGERVASIIGGAVLALTGLTRNKALAMPLLLGGGYLLYRGISGHCVAYQMLGIERAGPQGQKGIEVSQSISVNRPRAEVYRFWRNLENLPRFMQHLASVEMLEENGHRYSHWVAKAPLNTEVSWDAEIVDEAENERLAWRSLPGSTIDNGGAVLFADAPGGGTEVHVRLDYDPPAGSAGAAFARLFGAEPNQQVAEDLRNFKQLMETGETATVGGQASGRTEPLIEEPGWDEAPDADEAVEIAAKESFPASDPPAFTRGDPGE